jgi:DNA-binding transcriptional regulator YbjK
MMHLAKTKEPGRGKRQTGELTARGTQRRSSLIAAALRITVRDGPGSVTLRTVATEADASHGLVAYYFGTREDLIRAALNLVATKNIEALETAWRNLDATPADPATLADKIARHSVHQMIEDRTMGITIMELHLAAARFAVLRSSVRDWGRAYARITRRTFERLGSADPARDSGLLTSLISGLVIGQLALPRRGFEADVLRPAIEEFLRMIVRRAAQRQSGESPA